MWSDSDFERQGLTTMLTRYQALERALRLSDRIHDPDTSTDETDTGTLARRYVPPRYGWADPAYAVVHASIVPCARNLLAALRGEAPAETTAEDNVETLRLVFADYESARTTAFIVSFRSLHSANH